MLASFHCGYSTGTVCKDYHLPSPYCFQMCISIGTRKKNNPPKKPKGSWIKIRRNNSVGIHSNLPTEPSSFLQSKTRLSSLSGTWSSIRRENRQKSVAHLCTATHVSWLIQYQQRGTLQTFQHSSLSDLFLICVQDVCFWLQTHLVKKPCLTFLLFFVKFSGKVLIVNM